MVVARRTMWVWVRQRDCIEEGFFRSFFASSCRNCLREQLSEGIALHVLQALTEFGRPEGGCPPRRDHDALFMH